jgi:hypothetical protein
MLWHRCLPPREPLGVQARTHTELAVASGSSRLGASIGNAPGGGMTRDATIPDTTPSSPTRILLPMPTLPAAGSLTGDSAASPRESESSHRPRPSLALIRQSRETEEHSFVQTTGSYRLVSCSFMCTYKHNSGSALAPSESGKNFGDTRRLVS